MHFNKPPNPSPLCTLGRLWYRSEGIRVRPSNKFSSADDNKRKDAHREISNKDQSAMSHLSRREKESQQGQLRGTRYRLCQTRLKLNVYMFLHGYSVVGHGSVLSSPQKERQETLLTIRNIISYAIVASEVCYTASDIKNEQVRPTS